MLPETLALPPIPSPARGEGSFVQEMVVNHFLKRK
jgi:hypothetical protein